MASPPSRDGYVAVRTKIDDSTNGNVEAVEMTPLSTTMDGGESPDTPKETERVFCGYLHGPHWLLFAVCFACFIQGIVTDGLVVTSVTSIERRFSLTSTQSGILVSLFFVAQVAVTLFVGYFGGRGHKARWIASGMTLCAIGAFLYALPHFLSGYYSYDPSDTYSYLCVSDEGDYGNETDYRTSVGAEGEAEGDFEEDTSGFLYFFAAAQLLFGLGTAPLFCLGVTYLDENVSVHRSGLYIGVFYAVIALGPAVGYIVGGVLLNTYTDFHVTSDVTITPEDPGWVGAWWICMLISSPLAIVSAAFLLLFPKELPGSEEIRDQKTSVAHQSSGHEVIQARPDFGKRPSDFFIALALLIRNPTMMFLTAVSALTALIIVGNSTYLPKLIETLFGQRASFSASTVGAAAVIGGSTGSIVGGWLVKKYRWDIRENITFCIAATLVSALSFSIYLLSCPGQYIEDVSSLNEMYEGNCLSDCDCPTKQHHPVCASDGGAEYFSPCHAGCTHHFTENNTFGGCSCIPYSMTAVDGPCQTSNCPQLIVFIGGLFLFVFSIFVTVAPKLHATLRSVPESQRSLCMGLHSVLVHIFGSFPASILFGAIFDSACVVWQEDEVDEEGGSCWIYDNGKLSWRLFMLSEVLVVGRVICYVLSIYFYKPVTIGTKDNDEEKKDIHE